MRRPMPFTLTQTTFGVQSIVGRVPPREIVKVFKGMDLYADDHVPLAEFCMECGLVELAREQLYYFDRVRGVKEQEIARGHPNQ